MSLSLPRGWWGYHWSAPHPRSIVELVRARTLDAELAATLWLLVEGRVPVVVAARPPLAGKSTLLTALLAFLPSDVRPVLVRGWSEDFAWLPEAAELGWVRSSDPLRRPTGLATHIGSAGVARIDESEPDGHHVGPSSSYLLVSELSNHLPIYTWGEQARVAVRATTRGYGLGATIHADSLAEVFEQLQGPAVALNSDDLRGLGVVLVMRMFGPDGLLLEPGHGSRDGEVMPLDEGVRRRVVAAHYVRPLERDAGGHVQRRPPAVLATWNPATDSLDHFGWAISTELAARVGRTAAEFEREVRSRAALLARLAAEGILGAEQVARAIEAHPSGAAVRPGADRAAARSEIPVPASKPTSVAPAIPFSMPPEPS